MTNEKRLIDANALKCAINEYMIKAYDCPLDDVADFQQSTNNTKLIYAVQGLYEATEIIEDAQTVDAVEVVRCKDCKHWKLIDTLNPHRECQIFCGLHDYGYPTNADDFCSYGERKDNG